MSCFAVLTFPNKTKVGCIQVYLFNTVLLLRAAKKYPDSSSRAFGDDDPLAHITNTARQAEDASFREEDKSVTHGIVLRLYQF